MISKRLLTTGEAAHYCGMGRDKFKALCAAPRVRVHEGHRGLRFDVRTLDEWIDTLPVEGEKRMTKVDWLALAGNDEPRRRRK